MALQSGTGLVTAQAQDSVEPFYVAKLQDARRAHQELLTVVVASAPKRGAIDSLARYIRHVGGSIVVRLDDVGYIRAIVPTARFEELASRDDVSSVAIDWVLKPRPPSAASDRRSQAMRAPVDAPAPALDTTTTSWPADFERNASAYVPLDDMGVGALRKRGPAYDGRGITAALVEGESYTLSFDHSLLQSALSREGKVLPKIAGIIDPRAFEPAGLFEEAANGRLRDDCRIARDTTVTAERDGKFSVEDVVYTAPSTGQWHFGSVCSAVESLIARDKPIRRFGVIWRAGSRTALVDTNRDNDFTNEQPLTDVNRAYSLGHLQLDRIPYDRPDAQTTPVPFVIGFDVTDRPMIYEGFDVHATMTGTALAGGKLPNGVAVSAAPAARILPVFLGMSLGREIEARVRALEDPRVDLVSSSGLFYSDPLPASGAGLGQLVISRALALYRKPSLQAAGNRGLMSYGDTLVDSIFHLSVGAQFSRDTEKVFFGSSIPDHDGIWASSNRGPLPNGAMFPDIVAPLHGIVGRPCHDLRINHPIFALPACYRLSGGTSTATPRAAGAVAALMSGIRQRPGRRIDVASMMSALRSSARWLEQYDATEQGMGVLDVDAAWQALVESKASAPFEITGHGLYKRFAFVGQRDLTETLTLTRTTGPSRPVEYSVRLRGAPSGYEVPPRVPLPLNVPVTVAVSLKLTSPGAHVSVMELVSSDGQLARAVPLTLIAGKPAPVRGEVTVRWPDPLLEWIWVPEGVRSLHFEAVAVDGKAGVLVQGPVMDPNDKRALVSRRRVGNTVDSMPGGKAWTQEVSDPPSGLYALTFVPYCPPDSDADACEANENPEMKRDARVRYVVTTDAESPTLSQQTSRVP